MSILDLNLDSVPDLQTMPDGSEAELESTSCKLKKVGDEGYPQLLFSFKNNASDDETEYMSVFHTLWLPSDLDRSVSVSNAKRRALRDFFVACDIDASGLPEYLANAEEELDATGTCDSYEPAVGKTIRVILKEVPGRDAGSVKNEIARIVKSR